MKLKKEHIDFESYFRQIIGLKISKVKYAEIRYNESSPEPNYFTKFENMDSIDFSIILYTEDDKLIEIIWDWQFFQYGIGIKINDELNFKDAQIWNVSESDLWMKFIGKEILDLQIHWEEVYSTGNEDVNPQINIYPQSIKLMFSNNKNLFISAARFHNHDDSEVLGMFDNLILTDNEELAKSVKMI